MQVTGYGRFDGGSYVLRLSKPPELQLLHEANLGRVKPYGEDEAQFMKMMKESGFRNYNPHRTISKTRASSRRSMPDAASK